MSTETDQAAARKAQDLYRLDGSDPDTILALRSAFRAGAEFAAEHAPRCSFCAEVRDDLSTGGDVAICADCTGEAAR